MSRQRVPLGKAARATRRVSSGRGVESSGWSDIDRLTRATEWILNTADHAPDRFVNPLENDFATSVNARLTRPSSMQNSSAFGKEPFSSSVNLRYKPGTILFGLNIRIPILHSTFA